MKHKSQEEEQKENVLTSNESDCFVKAAGKPDIVDHSESLFSSYFEV